MSKAPALTHRNRRWEKPGHYRAFSFISEIKYFISEIKPQQDNTVAMGHSGP